jgi:hypothetical protein
VEFKTTRVSASGKSVNRSYIYLDHEDIRDLREFLLRCDHYLSMLDDE